VACLPSEKLVYNSSLQGDKYAAIRFDQHLRPVYPLVYYRQELKRTNLAQAFLLPHPEIAPKPLRLWWDRTENKGWWFGGLLLVATAGLAVTFVLRKRSDPMEVARRFFSQARFQKVEPLARDLLLLRPQDGHTPGIAALWQEGQDNGTSRLATTVRLQAQRLGRDLKLYIIYKDQGPSSDTIQQLRAELGCETIPLLSSLLERAWSTHEGERVLKELEEPYLTRIDPYAESKPIHDPTWFYGRDELLQRLPAVLSQGQHIGIFGLRKVGKTSLMLQLRQRFLASCTVYIDCQAFSTQATVYFEEILRQLHAELRVHGVKALPPLPPRTDGENFRQQFLALFERWEKVGRREPVLIILDEIDKLFPHRAVPGSEEVLAEYVHFFRVLRGLAQSRRCLVTLVIAYRPDVNRHNLLPPTVGENPMFRSFQEELLGCFDLADSTAMISEIGLWKQIVWERAAAQRVFDYCGGHPLITRFFASHACEEGARKAIDFARVEETAREIEATLRRTEIGNYYKEGVWDLLREDEQQGLSLVCQCDAEGVPETDIPRTLDEALTNLEHFGLVVNNNGHLHLTARLLQTWLQRRIST
jgi:hypothetical protein